MSNEEFEKMFSTMAGSNTTLPTATLLAILAGIVRTSEKDAPDVVKVAEALKDLPVEEIISKTILFTCNSIVTSLWNEFGKEFTEAYNKRMAAEKEHEEESAADGNKEHGGDA